MESPDFEKSTIVGTALIALYSRYLQLVQKRSVQLSLFIYDQLATEFSALGALIWERIPMTDLLTVYRVTGTSSGFDGDDILTLARRNNVTFPPDHRLRSLARLSEELWVRSSMIAGATEE